MIFLNIALAIGNAAVSIVLVALAVPGSGTIGPGFRVISMTFLLGNIAAFGFGLFSRLRLGRKARIAGLVVQIATVPLCLGMALLIMYLLGISDL